jgi:hypothetical protein
LPTEAHARAERAITSRFGKIMPLLMTTAILSFVPILLLVKDRCSPSFFFTLVGMLCYVAICRAVHHRVKCNKARGVRL